VRVSQGFPCQIPQKSLKIEKFNILRSPIYYLHAANRHFTRISRKCFSLFAPRPNPNRSRIAHNRCTHQILGLGAHHWRSIDDSNFAIIATNRYQINLIGHSAGGWISRIFIGAKPYDIHNDAADGLWNNRGSIATLISLGTPQVSGERWTKKNLNFVNDNYPGAFYPEVDYTCVAGKSLYGESRWGLAYQSYQITCGNGQTWGDGITPIEAAHLTGARNLVIEGVKHSPRSKDPWYGSSDALEQWVGYLK
jgi:hypothetical protein